MFTPVEELGESHSVVEDQDGYSILLTSGNQIPIHVWQQALDDHSVMLIVDSATGSAISVDEFLAERKESVSARAYEVVRWRTDLDYPSLREYHQSGPQADDDPLDSTTFVHLHTHFEYSPLDGLSTVDEVSKIITEQGQGALGSCDHGNCAAHPELQEKADQYGFKPIFGMEAYFVPDRHRRSKSWLELDGMVVQEKDLTKTQLAKAEKKSDSRESRNEYTHLSLWAESQNGLRNLWAMSTEGYREGLWDGKPRIDWDTLDRLSDGVLCGTGCLRGPVTRLLITCDCGHEYGTHSGPCAYVDEKNQIRCDCQQFSGQDDAARDTLMRLAFYFPERLYVELHANTLESQRYANQRLAALAREYDLPMIMAVDSHYPTQDKRLIHKAWVSMQTGKTLEEDTSLFQGDQHYHLKTEAEIREATSYLPSDVVEESIANTVALARRCTAKVKGEVTTPTYSNATKDHPDPVKRDVDRVLEICLENWARRTKMKTHSQQVYMDRLEREMGLLISKQFCGYFLIVWDYVAWAKKNGCLVGPSRGSGGGSLVAYLLGITETDPVEHDLIFERFLTEGRTSLPDFDIDFPTSWRARITNYIRERWGEDYTSSIGTVGRMRAKQALNDVYRALEPVLPYEIPHIEREALKKIIDEANAPLAGKQLPWDEVCDQFSDLIDPMRARYPEVFDMVDNVVDRLRQYGKHAAGVVISTGSPLTELPMFMTEVEEVVDGKKVKRQMMLTQFDMNALDILGYVKFDILTLRTLDTLQTAVDLIEAKTGRRVNPYDWTEEYYDPQVWEQVANGKTLGLFQVETPSGTRMIRRMEPSSLEDLAAAVTVVRPGPMRSGLTESYLRRRAGIEPVSYPDARMEEFVGNTYGAMIYQEQVMAACMTLAGYTSDEADGVRKLLGKKQVEKVVAAGQKFIEAAVPYGTEPAVAEFLWNQMAEFAKYGFNRAHAYAYAVLGYWTAWLKFHFPKEFLLACMSTVDNDRIPDFIEETRRMGYDIRPPDINLSKTLFSSRDLDVIYGLSMVPLVGTVTADQIVKGQPYSSLEDFLTRAVEPTGSAVNMGHVKALVGVGAFDSLVPNRRAVEVQLERESDGTAARCVRKTDAPNPQHPFRVPCSFDWANEVDPPLIRKRVDGKMQDAPKDPPKRCTVACRQYLKPPAVDTSTIPPMSTEEIVAREREILGVWISASPWEPVAQEHLDNSDTAETIESGPAEVQYVGVCIVEKVKTRKDKNGNDYAFVNLNMQDGSIEPVCFASVYGDHRHNLTPGTLGVVVIQKTTRGTQLQDFTPYPSQREK